jgi:hypothetical protein
MPVFIHAETPETSTSDFTPLATGEYLMKIATARVAPSVFPNKKGQFDDFLKIRWQLAEWSPEFEEAGYERDQAVFQDIRYWNGVTAAGVDSHLRQFILPLIKEGLVPEEINIAGADDPDDQGDLIGIVRRVLVVCEPKQEGPNKGKLGNKVRGIAPPRKQLPSGKVDLNDTDELDPMPGPVTRNGARSAPQGWTTKDAHKWIAAALEPETTDVEELREYANDVSGFAGGFWAKRDFSDYTLEQLKDAFGRMKNYIDRSQGDPNEDLFPS